MFFSDLLAVTKISLNGLEELDRGRVLDEVRLHLTGRYRSIVSKNNLILIRTSLIRKDLMIKFPKIEGVVIKRNFPSQIDVFIKERRSVLALCNLEVCYTVDEKGKTFMSFDPQESDIFIILSDKSNKPLELDESVLDEDYLNYVLETKDRLEKEMDIQVEKEYETPSLASSDIRLTTQEGWRIYFNKDIALDKELEMLQAVLNDKIGQDKKADLEYVDLRSDNKVYYKFKDGTQEVAQSNTEIKQNDAENKEISKKKKK